MHQAGRGWHGRFDVRRACLGCGCWRLLFTCHGAGLHGSIRLLLVSQLLSSCCLLLLPLHRLSLIGGSCRQDGRTQHGKYRHTSTSFLLDAARTCRAPASPIAIFAPPLEALMLPEEAHIQKPYFCTQPNQTMKLNSDNINTHYRWEDADRHPLLAVVPSFRPGCWG